MATIHLSASARAWMDRRFVWAGGVTGVLGGLCCIGGAIAMATGLSALSFFTTLSDRYTAYFIAASAVIMLIWLGGQVAAFGFGRDGLRRAGTVLGRQALVMGAIYGLTLGLAVGAMRLAEVAL